MSPKWVRGGERPKAQSGVLLQLRPYELHGTRYYAVAYRLDSGAPDAAREARVSFEMIYDGAQPGDRILIESVLGVVDRIAAEREAAPE
jgi:hypothetical protein